MFDGNGPNGSLTWLLGFVALLLPGLGALLAGPVMTIQARREAVFNEFAREHARRAANWGLTYSAISLVAMIVHFGALAMLHAQGVQVRGFGGPLGLIVVGWMLLSAFHLGVCGVGFWRARRGMDFHWWAAIPVLR